MQQYNGRIVFDGIIDCAKACLENGIPVGLGTDTGCPYITHYDMWREVYYFHKYCGVSNALLSIPRRSATPRSSAWRMSSAPSLPASAPT